MARRTSFLGWYLLALGAIQAGILAWLGRLPVYANPQAGIAMALRLGDISALDRILLLVWLFAAIRLLLLGALIVFKRRPLKSYLVTEIILASPTLVLIGQLLLGFPSGLARLLLLSIILVFIIYTAIPIMIAVSFFQRVSIQPKGR